MGKKKRKKLPWIAIAIILLALVLLYLAYAGLLPFSIGWGSDVPDDIIDLLENPPPGFVTCVLSASKTNVCVGETVTGSFSGQPNDACSLYGSLNGVWMKVGDFNTGSSGRVSSSISLPFAGTYQFVVLCSQCLSNRVTIVAVHCGATTTIPDDNGVTTTTTPQGQTGCNAICLGAGYNGGWGPVDSPGWCDYPEVYYTDNYGTSCCCYTISGVTTTTTPSGVYCESEWPIPSSQSDCTPRYGCPSGQDCIFVSGGLGGTNVCECMYESEQGTTTTTTTTPVAPQCSDSDWSGNTPWPEDDALSTQSFIYGYVIHNMAGYESPAYDYCYGSYVYEKFCNYAGYFDYDSVYCDYGCESGYVNGHSAGRCKAAPTTTTTIAMFCNDVDIGDNSIWGPGYCDDAYGRHYDECIAGDGEPIREWKCQYPNYDVCVYDDLGCDAYWSGGEQCHCHTTSDGYAKCCFYYGYPMC